MHNDFGGVIREETVFQNQSDAVIIEEIKSSSEVEVELKANNEEISLAKEFGAAKFVGNKKEDSGLKAKVNEEIMVELINETIFDLEITMELMRPYMIWKQIIRKFVWLRSLGRLHFWGWPREQQKNPTSRDNLSGLSQLKKSRDFLEAKSLHSEPNHVASTWTRRERKTKGNMVGTYQPPGKKRVTRT